MLLIVHLKGKTVAKSSPLKCEVKVVRFSSHGDAQESADGKKRPLRVCLMVQLKVHLITQKWAT